MKQSSPVSSQKDRSSVNRSAQKSRLDLKPVPQIKSNKFEPVSFQESIVQVDTIPIKDVTVDPQTIMRTHEAVDDRTNREIKVPVAKHEDSSLAQDTGTRIVIGGGDIEKPQQKAQITETAQPVIKDIDDQLSQNLRNYKNQIKDQKDYPLIIDIVQARGTPPDVQVLDQKTTNEQSKQDNKSCLSRQIMSGGSQEQLIISHDSLNNSNVVSNQRKKEQPKTTKNMGRNSRAVNQNFYLTRQGSGIRENNKIMGVTEQMRVSNMQRSLKMTQNSKLSMLRKSHSRQSYKSQRPDAERKSLEKTFVVRKIEDERINLKNLQQESGHNKQQMRYMIDNQKSNDQQIQILSQNEAGTRNHDLTHLQNLQEQSKLQTQSGHQDGNTLPDMTALKGDQLQDGLVKRQARRKNSQGVMSDEQIQIVGKEAEDLLQQIEDGEESPPRQDLLGTLGAPLSRGAFSSIGNEPEDDYLAKQKMVGRQSMKETMKSGGDINDTIQRQEREPTLVQEGKVQQESKTIHHQTEGSHAPLELNVQGISSQPSIFNQPKRANAKSVSNLRALPKGDETTHYKKSASGDGHNFELSNYHEETARLKNTARQFERESAILERVDTNEFKVYATQKRNYRKQVTKAHSNQGNFGRQARQHGKSSIERDQKRDIFAQTKSHKNFRQTIGNFQMMQQTRSNYGYKRRQVMGARSASRMANPELGISTRRISAVRRRGPAGDLLPGMLDGSQKKPAVTKLHVPPIKANIPLEGGKADQTENSRDAMIKLVDLDRYVHQGEVSPSRKSNIQTLNGASATGLLRQGHSSGKQGGDKPLAASISLESLKAINKLAANSSLKPLESRKSSQAMSHVQQVAVEQARRQQNLGQKKHDASSAKQRERTDANKVPVIGSAIHTPPALDAIYSTEVRINEDPPSISREDNGHAEKIRRLQAHQHALQLGSGTIEAQVTSPRSDSEYMQIDSTARNAQVFRQPGAMSVEGTQLRGQVISHPLASNKNGGPTISSLISPGRAALAIDFLQNQGTKLEAAVSALNGAVYQNRGQH